MSVARPIDSGWLQAFRRVAARPQTLSSTIDEVCAAVKSPAVAIRAAGAFVRTLDRRRGILAQRGHRGTPVADLFQDELAVAVDLSMMERVARTQDLVRRPAHHPHSGPQPERSGARQRFARILNTVFDIRTSARKPTDVIWRLSPVVIGMVLMWLVTAVNLLLLQGSWLSYGIRPRDPSGLWPNMLVAPFLHVGLAHLLANSAPFAGLGGLIALQSPWRFALVSLVGAVVGAVVVWILGPSGSVHVGASGLVFTYFGWLIARAIRERSAIAIALGVVTLLLYGGVLWGLSPFQIGISWQGHLGGLLGGLGFARVWPTANRRLSPAVQPRRSVI